MKNVLIDKALRASRLGTLFVLAGCLVSGSGCRSTHVPASATFASVVISGNTPGQIRDAAVEVFSHHGYTVAQADPGNLVFEKEGSKMNNVAYGNWLGDTPVWLRVKAAIVPMEAMSCRLQCHAYMVRDRGGATEEEITLSRFHNGQYQKLLDQVAEKFARK